MNSDFLNRILEHKRGEVEEARGRIPEKELREKASACKSGRSLATALHKPGVFGANIIAEIKRASPSRGAIRVDLDAADYARAYEHGGAAAISVLTDRAFFQAQPDDLPNVRASSTLPILRKDFVISTYQVYETAAMGADALLLIVRALAGELLQDLLTLSGEMGLDALVEVHSESELEKATKAGARLIGINNRDLSSFQTDIRTSIAVARHLEPGQVAVSESGIRGRKDIETLLDAGIWNFLIGESLVRSAGAEAFLGDLLGRGIDQKGTIRNSTSTA